jgi:hypothetical protein
VVDTTSPTNRTLEQPYRAGVNYTSVLDGFLVSPNIEVVDVTTIDLGAHSDHNRCGQHCVSVSTRRGFGGGDDRIVLRPRGGVCRGAESCGSAGAAVATSA